MKLYKLVSRMGQGSKVKIYKSEHSMDFDESKIFYQGTADGICELCEESETLKKWQVLNIAHSKKAILIATTEKKISKEEDSKKVFQFILTESLMQKPLRSD